MHTQDTAFVALMHLACANCSRPLTLAYLNQLDSIKLIYNTIKKITSYFFIPEMM